MPGSSSLTLPVIYILEVIPLYLVKLGELYLGYSGGFNVK